MKTFRLSRSSTTRHAAPARRPPAGRAGPPDADTRLPHRPLVLHALRQLARGHYLIVGGETSLAVRLPGVPDAVHLVDEFIGRRLVSRVEVPDCAGSCYALSDAGRDALERGERWWRELTLLERAVLYITG